VDRGRIWRIASDNPAVERGLATELGKALTSELVAQLGHRNGWHRFTAQRLLLERQDASAADPLASAAASAETPQHRLHALWALEGLGALTAAHVRKALTDEHAGVRRNAVRLAERFPSELASAIVAMQDDADAKVRFQVALSLGEIEGAVKPLAAMAAKHADDPWMRAAILTSAGDSSWAILNRLLVSHGEFFAAGPDAEGRQEMLGALAAQVGANPGGDQITLLLQAIGGSPRLRDAGFKAAALGGLARGLDLAGERRLRVPGSETLFSRWAGDADEKVRDAALEAAQYFHLPGMLADARRAAASEEIAVDRRVRAVRFLRGGTYEEVAPALSKILASPAAPELQVAAIETFSSFEDPAAAKALLAGWTGYGPAPRQRAVDAMIRRSGWVGALLDSVESGEIAASAIDPVAKIRLAEHPEPGVRERASTLLGAARSDRAKVVEEFQDALELKADSAHGEQVFEKNCAKCHLSQGERGRLGPDLSGINNKTREELLAHILDPSFEIQSNYTNYIVVDKQGRIFDGLLASETAEAVMLRGEYENVSLRRDEIEEMRASNVSLMPEGLEADMSRQDLADVIAYLRAGL
jgi:putative heme-binding domain-containing protein